MKFVVGQQLDSARKILLENAQRKFKTGALAGGNVVESLLEGDAIERLSAVGVEAVENIGKALPSGRRLQIVVVADRAKHGDGGAGGVGADDEANAVGQF